MAITVPQSYRYLMAIAALFFFVFTSCRKDFEYVESTGGLEFSKDTVFLDTVFTNIGSSTYTLKVYNRSNDDWRIPFIGLKNGAASKYRLNVDGLAGQEFTDIPLLAKDSMFVFVETTFDIETVGEREFLHTDAIQFGTGGDQQEVQLVTLVRDAVFLYPRTLSNGMEETLLLGLDGDGNEIRIEGFVLEDTELNFTNEKPYVIYGYAAVPNNRTLTIEPGARVHFHKDSGILVSDGGAINAIGQLSSDQEALENEIIFEGDRLEPGFSEVAGQWGTIWLTSGSVDNTFEYTTIKNATVGVLADGTDQTMAATLSLANSKIINSGSVNLWGRTARINAENVVLGNSGEASLYCNLGGDYDFKQCTIANYWSDGFRSGPALLIDNFLEIPDEETINADLTRANFSNCIIDGNKSVELLLFKNDAATFEYNFLNCTLKFNNTSNQFEDDPLYDFENTALYENLILNGNLDYLNTVLNDFRLLADTDAIDQANAATALEVPFDILGIDRTQNPDIGAYEWVPEN